MAICCKQAVFLGKDGMRSSIFSTFFERHAFLRKYFDPENGILLSGLIHQTIKDLKRIPKSA
jgi:hypothetical protein